LTREEGLEVGHAAVIDIGVRPLQAPALGIGGKVPDHVLMDELLQIEAEA
jgi:hypothetical protein